MLHCLMIRTDIEDKVSLSPQAWNILRGVILKSEVKKKWGCGYNYMCCVDWGYSVAGHMQLLSNEHSGLRVEETKPGDLATAQKSPQLLNL